jgi:hypothetical protein
MSAVSSVKTGLCLAGMRARWSASRAAEINDPILHEKIKEINDKIVETIDYINGKTDPKKG